MELKRDEIVKALECCGDNGRNGCVYCPRNIKYAVNLQSCMESLMHDAHSLINELTEERDGYKNLAHTVIRNSKSLIKKLKEENERLRNSTVDYRNIPYIKEEVKADTVREMQERLKAKAYTNNYCQEVVLLSDIDQIAEEMIGEAK